MRKLIKNGRIHTEYKQMLTTTGRLSSVEPNLQNIPTREEEGKVLRKIFTAKDNRILVSADYSQIELRLLAHFSQDEKMVDIFNKNEDLHSMTASEVFGVEKDEVTSQMRRDAKAVNFGIIYGISEYGLAKNIKCSVPSAKKYIQTYFEKARSLDLKAEYRN
jgi:DNA polymerase-1